MGELSGQDIELFDRREAILFLLDHQLLFPDHVHELDSGQRILCGVERFEPQYGTHHPLDGSMVLFHPITEIPI